MIRPALYADIPTICALMIEGHKVSKYKDYPLDTKRKFRTLLMESIRSGNSCVFVAERQGVVVGFLVGMVDDLYHILNVKYATDLFFFALYEGSALLDAFIEWAKIQPGVVRIRLGATDVVEDYNRVAKLYDRKGLTQEGALYEMEIGS